VSVYTVSMSAGSEGATEAVFDRYFEPDVPADVALGLVMDRLLERLTADQRDVLHLVVVSGMTMNQAAEFLGWRLPSGWDRKRVSRQLEQGVGRLRGWLTGAPWMAQLLEGRVVSMFGEDGTQ
jgi:DNA-directed RNA polymerase specialized sigma24 family protein